MNKPNKDFGAEKRDVVMILTKGEEDTPCKVCWASQSDTGHVLIDVEKMEININYLPKD